MIVTVSGLVMIFLFAFLGYIKGVWRILTDFTALLKQILHNGLNYHLYFYRWLTILILSPGL